MRVTAFVIHCPIIASVITVRPLFFCFSIDNTLAPASGKEITAFGAADHAGKEVDSSGRCLSNVLRVDGLDLSPLCRRKVSGAVVIVISVFSDIKFTVHHCAQLGVGKINVEGIPHVFYRGALAFVQQNILVKCSYHVFGLGILYHAAVNNPVSKAYVFITPDKAAIVDHIVDSKFYTF